MKLLNLGCGSTYHPAWTNVDMISTSPGVLAADLRRPLPFGDDSFDVIYHSHVLEHFEKADAERFLKECLRVLKPGGTLRIVVPDLERIARTYLEKLDLAAKGAPGASYDYDWILLELLDQMVRGESGGHMKSWIAQPAVPNEGFVLDRIGLEYSGLRKSLASPPARKGFLERVVSKGAWSMFQLLRAKFVVLFVRAFGGAEMAMNLRHGSFRNSGEVHRWMYDRYSLPRLLKSLGAREIVVCAPKESAIENFASYELDSIGSSTRKPDSLFVEARK